MDCLFCKIINNELESKKIYEDDLVMVIMDAYPDVDGHTLIIPKKHYETFKDIPNELLNHINDIAKKYSEILMEKLDSKSITLLVNYGDDQVIKHYHLHLLPNFKIKATKTVEEVYEVLNG